MCVWGGIRPQPSLAWGRGGRGRPSGHGPLVQPVPRGRVCQDRALPGCWQLARPVQDPCGRETEARVCSVLGPALCPAGRAGGGEGPPGGGVCPGRASPDCWALARAAPLTCAAALGGAGSGPRAETRSPHKQAVETNILLTLRGWVRFQVQERVLVTEPCRGARRQRAPKRALRPKAPLDRGLSRPRGHRRGVPKSQEDPQTVRSREEGAPGMNVPSPTHTEVLPAPGTCLSPPSFPALPPRGQRPKVAPRAGHAGLPRLSLSASSSCSSAP